MKPQTKTKQSAPIPSEDQLLKALDELEQTALAKGDALEEADTEGGFSTEGTPLSKKADEKMSKAASKKKVAMKAASASDMGSGEDDEEGGGDEGPGPGDDESSEDTEKSFRQFAEEDETLKKGIEVTAFLESFVDRHSVALETLKKGLEGHIDGRISAVESYHRDFNGRLAKALVMMGNTVNEMGNVIKGLRDQVASLTNQPHVPMRKSVLSISEIQQPPLDQSGQSLEGGGDMSHRSPSDMVDWLVSKAERNEINPNLIIQFESAGYNPRVLPPTLYKSMVNDLSK